MNKMNLKNKIMGSLFLIILACEITTSYLVYSQSKNYLESYKKESLETLVLEREKRVVDFFDNSFVLAKSISQREEIINYFKEGSGSQDANILSILQNYNIGGEYSAIYLMDKTGRALISTDETFVGRDYSFREYFKKAIEGEPWAYMAIGATSNMPGYYISYPIKDKNEVIGVIVLKIIPEYLHKIFTKENIGNENNTEKDTDFIFTDENGVVIYSSDEKKNYHSLGVLTKEKKKEILESREFGSMEILPLDYDQLQKEVSEISYVPKSYSLDDEKDNAREFLMAIKIRNLPFLIIAEANLDKMLVSTTRNSYWLTFLSLIIILVGGFLAYFIISNFLKPIKELERITKEVAQGKYETLKILKTGDEIEDLSREIKEMANNLIKLNVDAEKKIKENSQDLEKTIGYMTGREIKMIELKKKIEELENKNSKNDQ